MNLFVITMWTSIVLKSNKDFAFILNLLCLVLSLLFHSISVPSVLLMCNLDSNINGLVSVASCSNWLVICIWLLLFPWSHPDVNECMDRNGGCSHQCCNMIGSFVCKCPTGMTLSPDRRTCTGETPSGAPTWC